MTADVPLRVDDEPVLLATKLHPPARRGLLPRPGLVHRLQPTAHRLTVLDAPAGWGKTSLLAEKVDPATGDLLGNFPQAFSHIGLVNAAWAIARAEEAAPRPPAES